MASRQGKTRLPKENREKVEEEKEGQDKEAKGRSQEVNREMLKARENEEETPKKEDVDKTKVLDTFMSKVNRTIAASLTTEQRCTIRCYAANNFENMELALKDPVHLLRMVNFQVVILVSSPLDSSWGRNGSCLEI